MYTACLLNVNKLTNGMGQLYPAADSEQITTTAATTVESFEDQLKEFVHYTHICDDISAQLKWL